LGGSQDTPTPALLIEPKERLRSSLKVHLRRKAPLLKGSGSVPKGLFGSFWILGPRDHHRHSPALELHRQGLDEEGSPWAKNSNPLARESIREPTSGTPPLSKLLDPSLETLAWIPLFETLEELVGFGPELASAYGH
jgi:hypothetical protein